jgi:hypothetical protein
MPWTETPTAAPAKTAAAPADSAGSGSVRTVSKNATSSAEVRTARTPIPSAPQASMTARLLSRHLPCPPDGCRPGHARSPGGCCPGACCPGACCPGMWCPATCCPGTCCPGMCCPASPCPGCGCGPVPMHSPSHSALDRSTQRSSPVPGRSARSRDRSVKYSWSPGREPVSGPAHAAGNRSSGSGQAAACSGSMRAALIRAANWESW